MIHRKLRVGMVGGGGPDNCFGPPHRRAILMDNAAELTAGALRSDPEEAIASARELFFTRGYRTWQQMIETEAGLAPSERIDYVTVITPNNAHFAPAAASAAAGFGVLCEKPLTMTLDEAKQLQATVQRTGVPFAVAHTYTGFPMVMLARTLVEDGAIGQIRKVDVWYPSGWLGTDIEKSGHKQASWRLDPARAGISGCGADIGSHSYQFIRTVTGLSASRVQSRLASLVPGRVLDDDLTSLIELNNGAIATIAASQVNIGIQNDCGFRVSGTQGTLEWSITDHNVLKRFDRGEPVRLYRIGTDYGYFPASIRPYLRMPGGQPEGIHEALANIHLSLQLQVRARLGEKVRPPFPHPGISDGVAVMAFIEAAVASSQSEGAWTSVA